MEKIILDEDPDLDFAGIKPNDFHQSSLCAWERELIDEDVENWFVENDSDPGYQVL